MVNNDFPDYRVEVWFKYAKGNAEDELEEQFREFMKQNQMFVQGGPVVFRTFH